MASERWVYGDGGFDGDVPYLNVYVADGGPIIASVLSEEVGIEQAEENARLIVAAPAMKHALMMIYQLLSSRDRRIVEDAAFRQAEMALKPFGEVNTPRNGMEGRHYRR